ncbi:MAG: ATP-binding protein, partial [Chloroflexota bacterium]
MASQQTTLVGRERERIRLQELLDDMIAGRGSLVLISGEAGIGKTTLVRDLECQARERGALVLSGACYDLTTTPPYGPWSGAIGNYQPVGDQPPVPSWFGNPDDLEKIDSQAALFEDTRRFFTAVTEQQPLVIVLEDLHWADPATSDLLRYLSRSLSGIQSLIVVTYRDDERRERSHLFELIPALVREANIERIELHRWNEADSRQLIARRYGFETPAEDRLTAFVHGLAEGNPFFTTELLHTLEGDGTLSRSRTEWRLSELAGPQVPPVVRQLIEQRLTNLPDDARRLLAIAAVIGHRAPFDLWREVSAADDEQLAAAVDEATRLHLVDQSPDRSGIEFRHALIRETLYSGLLGPHLRIWHRCVAEALVQQRSPDPNRIAGHFLSAGDDRAFEWLLRAGLRARQSAAWLSAAERFRSAAALLERDDHAGSSTRGWLLFYTGFLLRFSGDPSTLEYLEEAGRVAAVTGDAMLAGFVHYHRGASRCLRGDIRRGLEEIGIGITALEELARTQPIRATEEQVIAVINASLQNPDERVDNVITPLPQPSGDTSHVVQQRGVLVNWLAHAGYYHRARQDGEMLKTAVTAAFGEEAVKLGQAVSGLVGLGHAYAVLGLHEDARQ